MKNHIIGLFSHLVIFGSTFTAVETNSLNSHPLYPETQSLMPLSEKKEFMQVLFDRNNLVNNMQLFPIISKSDFLNATYGLYTKTLTKEKYRAYLLDKYHSPEDVFAINYTAEYIN